MSASNDLPVIEIVFLTGISQDEVEVKNLPILTVSYDEKKQLYSITSGFELIENALANCFQKIEQRSSFVLVVSVNLKKDN